MTPPVADSARTPGRPRDAHADEAIMDAMLALLAEGTTFDLISMDAIAARAGVGKATIYRRWPNKEALATDAVMRLKPAVPDLPGRSVREDLLILMRLVGQGRDARSGNILTCLMGELRRNTELFGMYQEFVEARRSVTRAVLRRGVATGELRPDLDVEVALAILSSPLILQNMLNWHPELDRDALPERVLDLALNGMAAPDQVITG